jgi:lysozyme
MSVPTLSAAGLRLIQHFEGFSPSPYRCPAGYLTIGYGHVIAPSERATLVCVSEADAASLLQTDVRIAAMSVSRFITSRLTQCQFDALVSFTFNLGGAALQRSRLRLAVNRGEQAAVPAEFRRWIWADGRKLAGLVVRRNAESRLYQGFSDF